MGTTYPSQATATRRTPYPEILRTIVSHERGYGMQLDDTVCRGRQLHVTEALSGQLHNFGISMIGKLSSPDDTHASKIQQITDLLLGQVCKGLRRNFLCVKKRDASVSAQTWLGRIGQQSSSRVHRHLHRRLLPHAWVAIYQACFQDMLQLMLGDGATAHTTIILDVMLSTL